MALETVEDIIRALQEHPEWREPLLNALLTDQYRQLPSRAERLEDALARLAEESAKTDQRMQEWARRNEERFRDVVDGLHALSETVRLLVQRMDRWETDIGSVKGITLELFYRDNATSILGRHFQGLKIVDKGDYLQQAQEHQQLSDSDWRQLVSTDLLVRGIHRQSGKEYLMAWEVSWVVDSSDVERAARQAEILRRWEPNTLAVVAGKGITAGGQEAAQLRGVLVVLDTLVVDGANLAFPE